VLCSNCGYENPSLNRFCGMCGTPLPQKPITAPGAQSTLSFTRLPIEVSRPVSSTVSKDAKKVPAAASKKASSTVVEEAPSIAPSSPEPQVFESQLPPVQQSTTTDTSSAHAEKNYFSQAAESESLEQFIAGFHYTPPSEEDEVTMTGDRPVVDLDMKLQSSLPDTLPEERMQVAESPVTTSSPVSQDMPAIKQEPVEPPPFAMRAEKTQAANRSRFLDIAEPVAQPAVPETHTSIGGPSFLGLSDTPAMPETYDTSGRSHWRAWLAIIVLLIFAGLGFLEWRAEKNQSTSGPIGIMKMQIERLRGKKDATVTPAPSAAPITESGSTPQPQGSGPDMQVVPAQKPQTSAPNNTNNPAPSPQKPANSAAPSTPAGTPQSKAQPPSQAPDKPSSTRSATDGDGNPPPSTPAATDQTPTRESDPAAESGKDELVKAENASDAAAASAWLWKSVAKGNGEAPIRLANMYIKGDGVPQNCEQALVLLRSAATKENAAARSRLGSLYAAGTCVPRDRVRAFEYMSSAVEANPNATWARNFREQLWANMTPQERTQAQKYR